VKLNKDTQYTAYVAAEECNEVAQGIMKMLRFGPECQHPDTGETNVESLQIEIGQLIYALQRLSKELYMDQDAITDAFKMKKETWDKWKEYYDN